MSPEQALAIAKAAQAAAKAPPAADTASEQVSNTESEQVSDTASEQVSEQVSGEVSGADGAAASDTVEIPLQARRPLWEAGQDESTDGTRRPDGEVTADVRRPGGPFPRTGGPAAPAGRPFHMGSVAAPADRPSRKGPVDAASGRPSQKGPVAAPAGRSSQKGPVAPAVGTPSGAGRERRGALSAAVLRVGDIPIKAVYGIGALLVTVVVVVLIFMVFAEDRPGDPVRVDPAQAGGPAASGAPVKPTPTIAVPAVPAAKAMTVFPGTGTPVLSYVVDQTAGVSYAQYGAPWAKTAKAPFSAAQKVGPAKRPQALIASGPVPFAVPKAPVTYDGYRKLAAKAAKWTLRYQPAGSTLTWTVSQRARYNLGWVLGYKVGYVQGGKKHSSQAYVFVVSSPAKTKPAMLFASVTDARKALYHDLNMLFWTARAS
ncbi:hypothetical protein ACWEN6_05035 [Sphaerisporangium sp. NPDC004334]